MILKDMALGSVLNVINDNKTTYEGIVRTIIGDSFIIQVKLGQPNFELRKKGDHLEYLIAFNLDAYRCISSIQEIKTNSQFATFVLNKPEILSQIERRKYVRLQTVIPISYYFLPETESYDTLDSIPQNYWAKIKNSFTVDLSGGGVSLITYENGVPNQDALLKFFLFEEIFILAKVVRCAIEENRTKFKASLQFKDINSLHQKLIIDYINRNKN